MNYQCTRNSAEHVSAAQAIAQGISEDGGLFVPESLPQYDSSVLEGMKDGTYLDRAERILGDFLTDFTPEEIRECVKKAYGGEKFSGGHPAPLVELPNCPAPVHLLELWHGPTCAFKDMALQLLPHLLTKSLQKIHSDKTAVILVATSGDTGKAALEGFRDVAGTKIMVFYPQNGVSAMQKTQMTTQEGENVAVCAIESNFDDAQTCGAIHEIYNMSHYVCDTHTAVAIQVYRHYLAETQDTKTPTVVASTANPYKFATSVLLSVDQTKASGDDLANVRALEALTGAPIPQPIAALEGKPVRFTQCCTPDGMSDMVLSGLGIAKE